LPGATPRAIAYLEALEAQGRYRHMIWPVHCEIGSWGHNVHGALRAAYNGWEERGLSIVTKVVKGENPWTEHYSAIRAEVPDPTDAATLGNAALLGELGRAERIYIAGEAGSHCVKATTEHLVQQLSEAERSKLVLLTDCMSPVSGFEAAYSEFVASMQALGVAVATAADAERELLENAA
jgi:nicotinamidase/pyrazinamidase